MSLNGEGTIGYADVISKYYADKNAEYDGVHSSKDKLDDFSVDYKVKIFDLTEPTNIADFQVLMTKIFKKDGKYVLLGEDPTWTKDGAYLVAVRWIELS